MKNTMKKIAISVAACMVLSNVMYAVDQKPTSDSTINAATDPYKLKDSQKAVLEFLRKPGANASDQSEATKVFLKDYPQLKAFNHDDFKIEYTLPESSSDKQCAGFVKDSRSDVPKGGAFGDFNNNRANYMADTFHVDTTPRIGAAFVMRDGPLNKKGEEAAADGHVGMVTNVIPHATSGGKIQYEITIKDANGDDPSGGSTPTGHIREATFYIDENGKILSYSGPKGFAGSHADYSMSFVHEKKGTKDKDGTYEYKIAKLTSILHLLYDKKLLASEKEDGTLIKFDAYTTPEFLSKFLLFTNEQMASFLDLVELYKTELGRAIRPNAWEGRINELLLGKNKDYFLNELKKTNEWQTKHADTNENLNKYQMEEITIKLSPPELVPVENSIDLFYALNSKVENQNSIVNNALSSKVIDNTKTIEKARKLELDRLLAKHDVDIFLLADNTGSMGGLVGSAQTNAQAILDALRADSRFAKVNAQFGVGRYLGDPSEGGETATSSYQLLQPITDNDTAVTTAINQWYASGGGDWEEGNFYAIQQVIDSGAATPRNASLASGQVTNWRTGAQKVIVVFGDAPSWQNSVNEKELKALAIAAGAKIVFIDTSGINVGQTSNVYASTSGQQMQDAAVEIADATGGSYMRLTDVSNIQDAVLNAIYDAVADNKWTGGMVSKIDSTVWRVRTPSSVTASSDASGKILTFTLTYPNQSDSTFSIDTASAAHVVGTEYYQGSISDATSIFGQDMSGASVFHANSDQDFFRYILQNGSSTVEGYYGERLSSSSKLPTSGVSTYDIRERVVSPYTKTSYASDTMKLFVNWATGKVYGFDTNALMDSAEGTAIFVGDIDRTALEISGNYTFKTRRLSASESSNLPRVIKDAMRDTTTLQLYGNAYPNGMGGTFGATYYSESGTPSLSSMMMSGYVNTKSVAKSYTPSDGEIWSGHAVGFVANRSTGAVTIDSSTTTDDVQMTLKPSTGEVKASITVTDGSTNRTLTTDYTDTNVYVNQNAFVAMKDSGSVPTYAATTMSENDSYNYLSWGTWSTELSASHKTVVDGSRWIAGKLTPTTSMPSSGTATYNGTVQGMSYESGALKTLNGTHTMNANFASGTITGTMNVNYASSGASYATTNLNAVSISGNGFAGGLNGTDNTGSIKGSFYGPAANEIGGTWALSKTGSSAAGIFAGKK